MHGVVDQSYFDFGFVPLSDQMLPDTCILNDARGKSPLEIYKIVRSTNKPNFMQTILPVQPQLNVKAWKNHLEGYWDRQLSELIQFGFPLDFNRSCPLISEQGNQKSADIEAYIEE